MDPSRNFSGHPRARPFTLVRSHVHIRVRHGIFRAEKRNAGRRARRQKLQSDRRRHIRFYRDGDRVFAHRRAHLFDPRLRHERHVPRAAVAHLLAIRHGNAQIHRPCGHVVSRRPYRRSYRYDPVVQAAQKKHAPMDRCDSGRDSRGLHIRQTRQFFKRRTVRKDYDNAVGDRLSASGKIFGELKMGAGFCGKDIHGNYGSHRKPSAPSEPIIRSVFRRRRTVRHIVVYQKT